MSSLCLSSVLTNANITMYQSASSDGWPQQQPLHPCFSPLTNSDSMSSSMSSISSGSLSAPPYKMTSPCYWTEDQVLEWISEHVDSTKTDAKTLSLDDCAVSGLSLCQMKKEQLLDVFGQPVGQQLYHSLQEHIAKNELQSLSRAELNETCQLLDNFLTNLDFPRLSTIRIGSVEKPVGKQEVDFQDQYGLTERSFEQSESFDYASSPDSSSSDSDPQTTLTLCSESDVQTEKRQAQPKRPRGRPPKVYRDDGEGVSGNPRKPKHAPRGTHLWEFIRDILVHPENNSGLMKWEDRRLGVFKFLKSEAVARMWGEKKKNSSMTYEKLSRAMRYYYKREILERVDGRRLVYKFGRNSSGWKIDEQ